MRYADLMPFNSKEIFIERWKNMKKLKINASFIKTPFGESNPSNKLDPYGLMVATTGPNPRTTDAFWWMAVQQNITKTISLVEHIGREEQATDFYQECCQYFPTEESPEMLISNGKDGDNQILIKFESVDRQEHVNRWKFNI